MNRYLKLLLYFLLYYIIILWIIKIQFPSDIHKEMSLVGSYVGTNNVPKEMQNLHIVKEGYYYNFAKYVNNQHKLIVYVGNVDPKHIFPPTNLYVARSIADIYAFSWSFVIAFVILLLFHIIPWMDLE